MMDVNVFMPDWNWFFAVKIVTLILAVGVIATVIPSYLIIKMDPVEVIRSE